MFRETYKCIESALQEITGIKDVGLIEGGEHADFASTVAFSIGRENKTSPVPIATDIADKLSKLEILKAIKIETKGPYINFIAGEEYLKEALVCACQEGYGNLEKRGRRMAKQ